MLIFDAVIIGILSMTVLVEDTITWGQKNLCSHPKITISFSYSFIHSTNIVLSTHYKEMLLGAGDIEMNKA